MSFTEFDQGLTGLEIAIIGMAGHFPGAENVDTFWKNLCEGVESITRFTDAELKEHVSPTTLQDPKYVKTRGILTDVEGFDAPLFGFSPREAEVTDPQHRLFLECAWEALEHAGYTPDESSGLIGVYAGVSMNTYLLNNLITNQDLLQSVGTYQIMIRNDKDYLATLTSYKLNLEGPSLVVQTACSTSLVAVHLASQGLLSGNCDIALAGGVSIIVPQLTGHRYQEGGIMSPDGHCRAFDGKAQGTVAGNGLGIVVLKRLDNALADHDYIHAIIKGSAINNDGAHKIGYTAPSIEGQAKAIRDAQLMADVEPDTISYIEAHGTGTPLGDPIEIAALTQAFRCSTDSKNYCAIGSVKTNIGHLDAAAGVAGLIKTVLSLEHGKLPPSLHFETPNPQIDFANSPFYVNAQLSDWPTRGTVRRAGVSSFGIGGTNAHVILEEAPLREPLASTRPWHVLVLSAATARALEQHTDRLITHLRQHPEHALADLAYTLQVGRKPLSHRRMVVCQDHADALRVLETRDARRLLTTVVEPETRPVAFLFPGQGAQYITMAQELYQVEPDFRALVDTCCDYLRPHLGLDLREVLYPAEHGQAAADQSTTPLLDQTWLTQPALFVIEYALAQLWISWGVRPSAMIGHSIGEYVAACLAGVLSLEQALSLVAARGRLIQQLPTGAMLSVPLSPAAVAPLLSGQLSLASINAPELCVVAGTAEEIARLERDLLGQGIEPRRLHTSHAFHSHMMEPALHAFRQQLQQLDLKPPQIPYLSNVSGTWITPAEATSPEYWVSHLRQMVRFDDNVRTLLQEDGWLLVEVGPGRTLTSLVNRQPKQHLAATWTSLPAAADQQSDLALLLDTLGRLWLADVPVRWAAFHTHEPRQRLPLPTYPFEHQRYWIMPVSAAERTAQPSAPVVGKQLDVADWFYVPFWKPTALPANAAAVSERQRWLVLSSGDALSMQLSERLERAGHVVTMVQIGAAFDSRDERTYTIDPRRREDYTALVAGLCAADRLPDRILHAWALAEDRLIWDQECFEQAQTLSCTSVGRLAQALQAHVGEDGVQIWALTHATQAIADEAALHPAQATALDACAAVTQAYPYLTCCTIDVLLPATGGAPPRLIDQLLTELSQRPTETLIAYRRQLRWVQRLEAVRQESGIVSGAPLRSGGVYLLIDGLSERGLGLAEYLAQSGGSTLVCVEAEALPARHEWLQRLAGPAGVDRISQKIRRAQQLEAAGAQVIVCSADPTDPDQMRSVIAEAERCYGTLHGVLYTCDGSPVATGAFDLDECVRRIARQAAALLSLEQQLQGRALDFCLVQTALVAGDGEAGNAEVSASRFMATFVHQHNRGSETPWTLISWDRWPSADQPDLATLPAADQAAPSITLAEATDVFRRIYAIGPLTQIVVAPAPPIVSRRKPIAAQPQIAVQSAMDAHHSRPNLMNAYIAPTNVLERTIVDIWQELLGIKPVGINDNFFELGGHSLLATQLMARLQAAFQLELPMRSIFASATVADLTVLVVQHQARQVDQPRLAQLLVDIGQQADDRIAPHGHLDDDALSQLLTSLTPSQRSAFVEGLQTLYLAGADSSRLQIVAQTHLRHEFPLSFAQQRIWFIDQLDPGNPAYNVFAAMCLSGSLNLEVLRQSLTLIVARHAVLHTVCVVKDGQPVQVIGPAQAVDVPCIDLRMLPPEQQADAVRQMTVTEAEQPFNLAEGPLLRCSLLRLGDDEHVLQLSMHHIVSDAWSLGIFVGDLTTMYEAALSGRPSALAPLTIQYADFAVWQRAWLQGPTLERELSYWKQQLAGAPARLRLPVTAGRRDVQGAQGALYLFRLPRPLMDSCAELCQRESVTLFMLLVAAFNVVLHHATDAQDLVIGTDVANRTQAETERLIGFFVNQLVLRTDLQGNPTFAALLQRVREVCLDAYAHQHLPFEQVVEALNPERSLTVAPLFQVKLILQNAPMPPLKCADLRLTPMESSFAPAQLDLILSLGETAQGLAGRMEYNANLFDPATIAQFAHQLELVLDAAVSSPDRTLHDLNQLLTDAEHHTQRMQEQQAIIASQQKLKHVKRKAVSVKHAKEEAE